MEQKQRRKMGHIVQRGSSWYVPVYLGRQLVRDPATDEERWKERRRWMRFGSYREAREALPTLVGKATKRTLARTTNERLGDYLARWLKNHERNIAAKTAYEYERILARHLTPALGRIALKDLEAEDIDGYITARLRDGLSPTSVLHHFTLLHKALSDAVRMKRLPSNPADAVERPKGSKREVVVLDEEQLRLFLGTAKRRSRYYRLYLMAALTGLRQSELCGLKWDHVDLATARISVQAAFYRVGGRQIWKEPKSASSRRNIGLSPELVEELRTLKREQDARRAALGGLYHEHGLVFCQDSGAPLHAHNIVRRDFRRVLTKAFAKIDDSTNPPTVDETPVPKITFHSLRHSFATLLLRHGTPMKVASSLLGHSSIGITMDLYSHALPAMRDEAIRIMSERLLSGRLSTESSTETVSTGRETMGTGEKGSV